MPVSKDQAASLRTTPADATWASGRKSLCCIAVASGKGGVGKTFVAANLAIALGRMNKKVLLVDGDLGLANADIVLGVNPKYTLQDAFFMGRDICDVAVRTPHGIDLLAASSGSKEMVSMGDARMGMLVEELVHFAGEYDVLLFDCASGITGSVTAFIAAAPQSIVVTTPQPTALMDVYALMKVIYQSDLTHDLGLVVNMADSDAQGNAVTNTLRNVVKNYLSFDLELFGVIPKSDKALQAVHRRQPLLALDPDDPASKRIRDIGRRILQKQRGRTRLSNLNAKGLLDGLLSVRGDRCTGK